MIVYQRSNFVVVQLHKSSNKANFLVINTKKKFDEGHTHLHSRKRGIDLVNFVLTGRLPRHLSLYCLYSLLRLSDDADYSRRIQSLIDTKLNKGKKPKYQRCQPSLSI